MACGSCGTSKGGVPTGCKDNGSCKSGGCNRLNVHDWLSLIPVSDFSKPYPYIEVSFNHGSRKDFYKAQNPLQYEKGDFVTVEGSSGGFDVGVISVTGELVKLQMKKKGVKENSEDIRKILHASTAQELEKSNESKKQEKEMMIRARVISRELNLQMKIAEVEMQADGRKATFFYTSDDRVDFRELIKRFAGDFKVKVEMRQIGIRQEAAKVGGIGSCGRELCCSTWLNDFKSVSTTAARYQNLSINQTKLSGQCGRLKCCLNYELDTYMDALRVFPENAERIKIKNGTAYLQKKDIFKNLMWYSFEKSNTLYPLRIERVNEIIELNTKGIFPDELQAVEVAKKAAIAEKTDYVDVVGQISLKSLERSSKKKNQKAKENHSNQRPQNPNPTQNPNQQNKPNSKGNGPRPQNPNQKPNHPNQKPNSLDELAANLGQGNKPKQTNPNQKPKSPVSADGTVQPRPQNPNAKKPVHHHNKPKPVNNNPTQANPEKKD
jgi:cell fate regulator YaaT (PSP1 superfamily)